MSFFSPLSSRSAACSRLEPPLESSRVSSNSLSESDVTGTLFDFGPLSFMLLGPCVGSTDSSKSSDESSAAFAGLGLAFPFPPLFSREMPASLGSRRLMPLSPPRLPPVESLGIDPRATSSLVSLLSFSSKSSLSASRLSSNSLLSPWLGAPNFLPASDDDSLLDDFGADSFAELPPLMMALPGPPKSIEISSVGTTDASSFFFLTLPDSRRTSLSPSAFGFFPVFESPDDDSEKMSSSEASRWSDSSAGLGFLGGTPGTLKSSEPISSASGASGRPGSLIAPRLRDSSSMSAARNRMVGPSRNDRTDFQSSFRRRFISSVEMPRRSAASSRVYVCAMVVISECAAGSGCADVGSPERCPGTRKL